MEGSGGADETIEQRGSEGVLHNARYPIWNGASGVEVVLWQVLSR